MATPDVSLHGAYTDRLSTYEADVLRDSLEAALVSEGFSNVDVVVVYEDAPNPQGRIVAQRHIELSFDLGVPAVQRTM